MFMQRLIEAIPGHDKEIFGISAESIITVAILAALIFITKEIFGLILQKNQFG